LWRAAKLTSLIHEHGRAAIDIPIQSSRLLDLSEWFVSDIDSEWHDKFLSVLKIPRQPRGYWASGATVI
jgi:hypothetical protein